MYQVNVFGLKRFLYTADTLRSTSRTSPPAGEMASPLTPSYTDTGKEQQDAYLTNRLGQTRRRAECLTDCFSCSAQI